MNPTGGPANSKGKFQEFVFKSTENPNEAVVTSPLKFKLEFASVNGFSKTGKLQNMFPAPKHNPIYARIPN